MTGDERRQVGDGAALHIRRELRSHLDRPSMAAKQVDRHQVGTKRNADRGKVGLIVSLGVV
ncbi:hypothetical protein [Aquibium microcysteis]|uniref:hypothetical protein n=1 Tax=Aquibium microcysteis TaxID=675281 RepID=UPI00165CF32E|nr:hypothetical protein [Aquibium microcysteis]